MSWFSASLLFTFSYYAFIAAIAWLVFRSIKPAIRFFRRFRGFFKGLVWPLVGISILSLSVAEGPMVYVAVALLLAILTPLFLLFFMQIVFWSYHAIKHQDPFYESGDSRGIKFINRGGESGRPNSKKMCPICKRPSRCKVSPKGAPIAFHIIR